MSLVSADYDSSSSSEEEISVDLSTSKRQGPVQIRVDLPKKTKQSIENDDDDDYDPTTTPFQQPLSTGTKVLKSGSSFSQGLFSSLPTPKNILGIGGASKTRLSSLTKPLPSKVAENQASQTFSTEVPTPSQPSFQKSLSSLPVKNNSATSLVSMVPYTVSSTSSRGPKAGQRKPTLQNKKLADDSLSFFPLGDAAAPKVSFSSKDISSEKLLIRRTDKPEVPEYVPPDSVTNSSFSNSFYPEGNYMDPSSSSIDEGMELDEEALRRLEGKKGSKRGRVDIVSINREEQLQHRVHDLAPVQCEPIIKSVASSQQRRKHTIMYLAAQAKEKASQLEEYYATQRKTKRETQSKYGF